MSESIRGGYYLKARCIEGSKIAHAPPHAREIFDYFLRKAFWQDGEKLKRGQWHTDYKTIREDLRWYVGGRAVRYEKHHVQTALDILRKSGAIQTAKSTRGFVVTILNYDYYQSWESYETDGQFRNYGEGYGEASTKPTAKATEPNSINDGGAEGCNSPEEGETYGDTSAKDTRKLQQTSTIVECSEYRDNEGKDSPPAREGFPLDLFRQFKASHNDCEGVRDFQFQQSLAAHPNANVAEAVASFMRDMAGARRIEFPLQMLGGYLRKSNKGGAGRATTPPPGNCYESMPDPVRERFDQFWEVFDLNQGREEAAQMWLQLGSIDEEMFQKILAGARREARNRNPEFAKEAKGWLSGHRWEDESPEDRGSLAKGCRHPALGSSSRPARFDGT